MDKDKIKGKGNEAAGKARREVGAATGNEKMEGRGAAQQGKGKVQKAIGAVKDKARDLTGG